MAADLVAQANVFTKFHTFVLAVGFHPCCSMESHRVIASANLCLWQSNRVHALAQLSLLISRLLCKLFCAVSLSTGTCFGRHWMSWWDHHQVQKQKMQLKTEQNKNDEITRATESTTLLLLMWMCAENLNPHLSFAHGNQCCSTRHDIAKKWWKEFWQLEKPMFESTKGKCLLDEEIYCWCKRSVT